MIETATTHQMNYELHEIGQEPMYVCQNAVNQEVALYPALAVCPVLHISAPSRFIFTSLLSFFFSLSIISLFSLSCFYLLSPPNSLLSRCV